MLTKPQEEHVKMKNNFQNFYLKYEPLYIQIIMPFLHLPNNVDQLIISKYIHTNNNNNFYNFFINFTSILIHIINNIFNYLYIHH